MIYHSKLLRKVAINNLKNYYKNILEALPTDNLQDDYIFHNHNLFEFNLSLDASKKLSKLFNFEKLYVYDYYNYWHIYSIIEKLNPYLELNFTKSISFCEVDQIINFVLFDLQEDEVASEYIEGVGYFASYKNKRLQYYGIRDEVLSDSEPSIDEEESEYDEGNGYSLALKIRDGDLMESELTEEELRLASYYM